VKVDRLQPRWMTVPVVMMFVLMSILVTNVSFVAGDFHSPQPMCDSFFDTYEECLANCPAPPTGQCMQIPSGNQCGDMWSCNVDIGCDIPGMCMECELTPENQTITIGQSATLNWWVNQPKDWVDAELNPGNMDLVPTHEIYHAGSIDVTPVETTLYTATFEIGGFVEECEATVTVESNLQQCDGEGQFCFRSSAGGPTCPGANTLFANLHIEGGDAWCGIEYGAGSVCCEQSLCEEDTFCGDGMIQSPNDAGTGGPLNDGFEDCDTGGASNNTCYMGGDPNAENINMCQFTFCGDGMVQSPNYFGQVEECDWGALNADEPNTCKLDCSAPSCGDGYIDNLFGETCDLGPDATEQDWIDAQCHPPSAGALACTDMEDPVEVCEGFCALSSTGVCPGGSLEWYIGHNTDGDEYCNAENAGEGWICCSVEEAYCPTDYFLMIEFADNAQASGETLTDTNNVFINVTGDASDPLTQIRIDISNEAGSYKNSVHWDTNLDVPFERFTTFTDLPNDLYYFNATVTDGTGSNFTEMRNVTIDMPPSYTLNIDFVTPPTYIHRETYETDYIIVETLVESSAGISTVNIFLYDNNGMLVDSILAGANPNPYNHYFENLASGIYYFNATVVDRSANVAHTATREVTLDVPDEPMLSIEFVDPTLESGTYNLNYITTNASAYASHGINDITTNVYDADGQLVASDTIGRAISDNLYSVFENLPNGLYYFNATVEDVLFNVNHTETQVVQLFNVGDGQVIIVDFNTEFPLVTRSDWIDAQVVLYNQGEESGWIVPDISDIEAFITDGYEGEHNSGDGMAELLEPLVIDYHVFKSDFAFVPTVGGQYNVTFVVGGDLPVGEDTAQGYTAHLHSFVWDGGSMDVSEDPLISMVIPDLADGQIGFFSPGLVDFPAGEGHGGLLLNLVKASSDDFSLITGIILQCEAEGQEIYCDGKDNNCDGYDYCTSIWFEEPTLPSGTVVSQDFIEINVSATSTPYDLSNIILYVYDAQGTLVESRNITGIAQSDASYYEAFTGLEDGLYYYNATAIDVSGNGFVAATQTRNITLYDTDAFFVTIESPEPITYSVGTMPLLYTLHNHMLQDSCWYTLNGGSAIPLPDCLNSTLSGLADGNHVLRVYTNDTLGNIAFAQREFTVLFNDIIMSYVPPTETNGDVYARDNIRVNVTATSTYELQDISIYLYTPLGDVLSQSIDPSSVSGQLYMDFTGLADGEYQFNATATDVFGHSATLPTYTIYITEDYSQDSFVIAIECLVDENWQSCANARYSDTIAGVRAQCFSWNPDVPVSSADGVFVNEDGPNSFALSLEDEWLVSPEMDLFVGRSGTQSMTISCASTPLLMCPSLVPQNLNNWVVPFGEYFTMNDDFLVEGACCTDGHQAVSETTVTVPAFDRGLDPDNPASLQCAWEETCTDGTTAVLSAAGIRAGSPFEPNNKYLCCAPTMSRHISVTGCFADYTAIGYLTGVTGALISGEPASGFDLAVCAAPMDASQDLVCTNALTCGASQTCMYGVDEMGVFASFEGGCDVPSAMKRCCEVTS